MHIYTPFSHIRSFVKDLHAATVVFAHNYKNKREILDLPSILTDKSRFRKCSLALLYINTPVFYYLYVIHIRVILNLLRQQSY